MTQSPLAQFDRAAAVAEGVIASTKPDQFDEPSPCTLWSVRQVINHVVVGNLRTLGTVTGQARPDPGEDRLGDDPLGAFRASVRELRAALSVEGALDRTVPTPVGERPGTFLVLMRVAEMTLHAWDVAKATGQSTDLDPGLSGQILAVFHGVLPADREGSPFGAEQPAPPDATAADRLAAYAGRTVS
ncbi:TIGR03086 family metal-binding protein [Rugosimonospora africana]|nr:TIGR03086 family metal-binding protein [Rugosimonospora africana]